MIPTIDPNVRYVGSSWLRGLNVETMKSLTGAVVVQDGDATAMIVILPYETYLAIQQAIKVNMEVGAFERATTRSIREKGDGKR